MCWLNWHFRCLRCCSKKLIWIVLMVGVVYVYELVMFNYGPTALKLRSDIDKLKKEIACANKELKLALQGIRRDFEGQLFALQRNVHHDAKNGHIKELLPDFIDMIKRIVAEEIQLYDADKTGLADYALGGSILSAIYTKIEVDTILGIPIHNIQGPEYIIQEIFRRPIQLIQFRFMTNQGDPMHTCVYRVRVHGQISL
ncbi:hypothetical protein C0J52_01208 [Blattella germanica]|nr:hypothetical protein C0J52_01208 [Blattella germanica]